MQFEFDSEIKRLEGKIKWSIVYFPYLAFEQFGAKGNIPVCISVDGYEFDHTLLPSNNGHYLVYNEFIRQAVGKELGDTVHVTLEKDERIRKYVIPEDIKNQLSNAGVLDVYLKQPNYLQREQVNYIEVAKKEKTKANRIKALIKRLGENK